MEESCWLFVEGTRVMLTSVMACKNYVITAALYY